MQSVIYTAFKGLFNFPKLAMFGGGIRKGRD